MRNIKVLKNIINTLSVLLLSVVIIGCNPKNSVTIDRNNIVINLACSTVGIELVLLKRVIEIYNKKNPDIEVKIVDTPDSAQERLVLYLQFLEAKSSDVDIYQIDIIWTGDLADHFVDMNRFGAKRIARQHFDTLIKNNTVKGRLVAIPWFIDAGLLYYRTDLLAQYKLCVPKTWEQLEKVAQKIQEGERKKGNIDFWGYIWQGDAYEGLSCNALEWIYSNGGGTIINADKKITINNPKAIEIIKRAASWIGTISPFSVTGMSEEKARNLWQSGNSAFMRNWPYAYILGNDEESPIKNKFSITSLPAGISGKSAATLGGWQLGVSKYSKKPDLATRFALFLASYEVQKMRAIHGSLYPTIKKLYSDRDVINANPYWIILYNVFKNAIPRPSTYTSPHYNNVSQLFYKAVYSVLTGKRDGKTAIEYLEIELKELTGFDTGKVKKS